MSAAAPKIPTSALVELASITPLTNGARALEDQRPAAVAQRQLQEAIAQSPQQHAAQLRATINQSPRQQHAAQAHAQLQGAMQRKANRTGLPDQLKNGVESLSGHSLDDVRVHYNSARPAQLQAHAYAQGTDIHLAPGQEQHLPHEAWHVVQQKQGRVRATTQLKGIGINDDTRLEGEADVMGRRALQWGQPAKVPIQAQRMVAGPYVVQQLPDWMLRLKALYTTSTGGLAKAANWVLTYFSRSQPQQEILLPEEQEEPEALWDNLEQVAKNLGLSPEELYTKLEDEAIPAITDQVESNIITSPINREEDKAALIVPKAIISNLPEDDAAKAHKIFIRLNARGFLYTGSAIGGVAGGFIMHSGDCSTLTLMFIAAVKAAVAPINKDKVKFQAKKGPLLVSERPIHGRPLTYNTAGEHFWHFDEHFWGVYDKQPYDLLFMQAHKVEAALFLKDGKHKGISYIIFDNNKAFIDYSNYEKLMGEKAEKVEGYVTADEEAVKRFIDIHTREAHTE
jgi:hypothetical protein